MNESSGKPLQHETTSQGFQKAFESINPLFRWLAPVGVVALVLAMAGCSVMSSGSSQPNAQVKSLRQVTNTTYSAVTVTELQSEVMRFADVYTAMVSQSADDFVTKAGTPESRLSGLQWKLSQATAAYVNACGVNPAINALDMLVLVTVSRMVIEDYGVEKFGGAILPLLETHRQLETNVWMLADRLLKVEQRLELTELIQEWRQKYPHQRYVGQIRFREFATALGKNPTRATTKSTSIFSLLYIDPLAGLDPTAAAIQETRQLGERAMYYTQRMPTLISWQTEVLVCRLADEPESKQMLADAARVAAAAESFAKTAEQLPQFINDQREATIQQLFNGLDAREAKGSELLTSSRQTLIAANEMAISINTAIKSLDGFVRYVSPDDPSPSVSDTNSKPFDVLDYGRAADQIGVAAKQLQSLLTSMDQSMPQLAQVSDQAAGNAERLMHRAFRLGLILIFILLAGVVLAGLTYRVIAQKWLNNPMKTSVTPPEKTD